MLITRRADFSASHFCRAASLSDEENRALFGEEAHPAGHGHNFVLEVSVEGEPDPVTGMIVDLKGLKDILEQEVVAPMDHRFLNYEVEPFGKVDSHYREYRARNLAAIGKAIRFGAVSSGARASFRNSRIFTSM